MSTSFPILYSRVPRIACRGHCHRTCGPIPLLDGERRHFEKVTRRPFPDVAKVARTKGKDCPLLFNNRCTVYQHRPLICRLWGVTEGMPCPYGCKAESVLTDAEAHRLIDQTK